MNRLRCAELGPIVGHVTDQTARIWIRGGDQEDIGAQGGGSRRMLGVIAIRKANKNTNRQYASNDVHCFWLRREFDWTGTFTFGRSIGLGECNASSPLQPGTSYEVRVGTLTLSDTSLDTDSITNAPLVSRLPPACHWADDLRSLREDRAVATFTTGPVRPADVKKFGSLVFLLGSCRYPGLLWRAGCDDRIFDPMRKEALGKTGRSNARFVLMMGDQIYADLFNRKIPIGRAETYAEFRKRYMTAFGSPNMRRLLRSVPTYMILDDHEIEDGWHQGRLRTARGKRLFASAMKAYRSYQWVHGPRNYDERLFYSFDSGGYPFFVLDTRTERYLEDVPDSLANNHMLGTPSQSAAELNQLDRLLKWLVDQQKDNGDVPKFIVSPSVFVPNRLSAREGRGGSCKQKVRRKKRSDSWPAFPHTRLAILEKIVKHSVQNVVFLSGDIHCANIAEMRFDNPGSEPLDIRAFSITSSALHWPYCFADGEPSHFVHDSTKTGQEDTFDMPAGVKMNYKAWNFTQQDNFCRVEIDPVKHHLIVTPFGTDGGQLLKGGNSQHSLQLTAW